MSSLFKLTIVPPTGGEGANTALCDSAALVRHLVTAESNQTSLKNAINQYEKEMLSFSSKKVSESYRMAKNITSDGYLGPFFMRCFLRIVNFFAHLFGYGG
jgi:salicylate hydroxylase